VRCTQGRIPIRLDGIILQVACPLYRNNDTVSTKTNTIIVLIMLLLEQKGFI